MQAVCPRCSKICEVIERTNWQIENHTSQHTFTGKKKKVEVVILKCTGSGAFCVIRGGKAVVL